MGCDTWVPWCQRLRSSAPQGTELAIQEVRCPTGSHGRGRTVRSLGIPRCSVNEGMPFEQYPGSKNCTFKEIHCQPVFGVEFSVNV